MLESKLYRFSFTFLHEDESHHKQTIGAIGTGKLTTTTTHHRTIFKIKSTLKLKVLRSLNSFGLKSNYNFMARARRLLQLQLKPNSIIQLFIECFLNDCVACECLRFSSACWCLTINILAFCFHHFIWMVPLTSECCLIVFNHKFYGLTWFGVRLV